MILTEIANIQVQAFNLIQEQGMGVIVQEYDLERFLQNPKQGIEEAIQEHITFWDTLKVFPGKVYELNSYQVSICAHILFTMESEWVQKNPEGVVQCWELIDELYRKHHPETQLLWKLQNLSTISMN